MMQTPRGLKAAGRRLFDAVAADYELDPPEAVLLGEACKMVDLLADLRAEVARSGLMVDSSQGIRVNPAAVEARQLALALTKLVGSLGLPKGLVK
ncbi:terminase [Mycobacterium sp. DSM 3803]|nr:terminase [Mycobacterium sp. DSM 3803]